MGLLGSAFRVSRSAARTTYRTGRTTYRAGKSISRGRVPNLGVNVGVGGLGVRVGTKGLSVKTPVARISAGTSGFRFTAGKPGIAHLTVNPTRPSATLGAGPLRINLSRHPGLGLRTGMVGLGVTSKPLVQARVGDVKFSLPGEIVSNPQRWHQQVDQQWRADYQRRPPSFLASLHDLIDEVESDHLQKVRSAPARLRQPTVPTSELTSAERKDLKKACKTELLKEQSKLALALVPKHRQTLKEHVANAIKQEEDERTLEQQELQLAANEQYNKWDNGDPSLEYIVLQGSFSAEECPAFVINHAGHAATIAVIVPELDDVHPEKPSYTKSGAKTVKKKTKKELQTVHRDMVTATVLHAINIAAHRLPSLPQLKIHAIERSPSSTSLETFNVTSTIELNNDDMKTLSKETDLSLFRGAISLKLRNGASKTPQQLHHHIENHTNGNNETTALLVDTASPNDLQQATFWLEAAQSLNQLQPHSPASRTQQQASESQIVNTQKVTTPTQPIPVETQAALTAEQIPDLTELKRIINATPQLIASATAQDTSDTEELLSAIFDALIITATQPELDNITHAVNKQQRFITQQLTPTIQRVNTLRQLKERVLNYIDEHPDVTQSTLPAQLDHDPSEVRRICWYLDHYNVITRTKKGRSYALSINQHDTNN